MVTLEWLQLTMDRELLKLVIILTFVQSFSTEKFQPTFRVGLLVDFNDAVTQSVTNDTIKSFINFMTENVDTNVTIAVDQISDFDSFSAAIEDDPDECRTLTAVLSAISCHKTKALYHLITDHCHNTVILSIHEKTCPRPPKTAGVGFPIASSVSDVVPMLVDMRHDFLSTWNSINLVHDRSVAHEVIFDLIDGLEAVPGVNNERTKVTTFQVSGVRKSGGTSQISNHSLCTTLQGRAQVDFSGAHLARHIETDPGMRYFVLMGRSRTIENVIEEAHNRSLLNIPRHWLLIFTDTLRKQSFWNNMKPILAVTDTLVVRRLVSKYGNCGQLTEGCQFRLAFETLREALFRVSDKFSQLEQFQTKTIRSGKKNRTENDVISWTSTSHEKWTRNQKAIKYKLLHEIHHLLVNGTAGHCGNCDNYVVQHFEKTEKKVDKTPWIPKKKKPTPKSVWVEGEFDVVVKNTAGWAPFKGYYGKQVIFPSKLASEFKTKEVKVAIFQQMPRIGVNTTGGTCNVNGSTYEIIKLLGERLNFTATFVCTDRFGLDKEDWKAETGGDGKFVGGALELVQTGKVHMGGNPYWKLKRYEKFFKWTIPFFEESVSLMVQKSTEDHEWLFLLPYTWDVWYGILLSFLFVAPFIYYVNRQCKYYDFNQIRKEKGLFTMDNCVWYSYGALVGQGGDYLPPALGTRTIVAFWWLFVIVTATTYSGNLVACLTFPKVYQPVHNVNDLLAQWFMDWATQTGGQIEVVTKTEKYQQIKLLNPEMEYWEFERNRNYIFKEVSRDYLAWVGYKQEIRHYVSIDYLKTKYPQKCNMHQAVDDIYRAPVHFVFNLDFPDSDIELMNKELVYLGMTGYIAHWHKYFDQTGNDCLKPTIVYAGDVLKIDLRNMYGGYCILACGCAFSIVSIIVEVLFGRVVVPNLPESFRRKKDNIKNYYNSILVGYGYSNARPDTPSRQALLEARRNNAPNKLANIVMAQKAKAAEGVSNGVNNNGGQFNTVYDNVQTSKYNTKQSYNIFNYDSASSKGSYRKFN